jgi:hypothetical protein
MITRGSDKASEKGLARKALPLLLVVVTALLAFQFTRLDESKKRFIVHLAKQAPYLPGRYYA